MSHWSRPHALARRSAVALLAVGLGVLTACSSDDDNGGSGSSAAADTSSTAATTSASESAGSSPTESAGGQQAAQTLDVTAVDFDFELASTDLPAGEGRGRRHL